MGNRQLGIRMTSALWARLESVTPEGKTAAETARALLEYALDAQAARQAFPMTEKPPETVQPSEQLLEPTSTESNTLSVEQATSLLAEGRELQDKLRPRIHRMMGLTEDDLSDILG